MEALVCSRIRYRPYVQALLNKNVSHAAGKRCRLRSHASEASCWASITKEMIEIFRIYLIVRNPSETRRHIVLVFADEKIITKYKIYTFDAFILLSMKQNTRISHSYRVCSINCVFAIYERILNIAAAFLNCSIVFADHNLRRNRKRRSIESYIVIRILIDQDGDSSCAFWWSTWLVDGVSLTRTSVLHDSL